MRTIRPFHRLTAALAAGTLALSLAGCGGDSSADEPSSEVTIAYQPGLGYAPLLIAKESGSLQEELEGVEVNWQVLDSGSAIRDGVIAGDIQIAAGGAGPFIVGRDGGVEWKTIMSMNNMNLQLMAKDPAIASLEDLEGGKIAMPAPDSIQSVVLRKGAQEELGDAAALDEGIVSLAHPDGVQALVSGQVDAHLTSPPFQAQEADQGAEPILDSYDLFGQHTFNSLYATEEFVGANPETISALEKSIEEATVMLNEDPEKAAELLSEESGGELSPEEMLTQIEDKDVEFTNTPTGFETFAGFMAQIGMIKEAPSPEDMFFENDYTADAS